MICGASFSFWTYEAVAVEKTTRQPDSYRASNGQRAFFFEVEKKTLGPFFSEKCQKNWRGLKVVQTSRKKTGDERQTMKGWQTVKLCQTLPKMWLNLELLHDFSTQKSRKKCSGNVTTSLWGVATTRQKSRIPWPPIKLLYLECSPSRLSPKRVFPSLPFWPSCSLALPAWVSLQKKWWQVVTYGWSIKNLHEIMDPYIDTMIAWKIIDFVNSYILLLHRSSTYLCNQNWMNHLVSK